MSAAFLSLLVATTAAPQTTSASDGELWYRTVTMFNQHFYFGDFKRPRALAFDRKNDELWMGDAGSGRIAVFRPYGAELFSFTSKKHVSTPARIAVTPSGDLAIIEGDHSHIRIFNYRGEYKQDLQLGGLAAKPIIGAIAYGPGGRMYVADNATAEILVYDADGRLRFRFGSRGTDEGQFMSVCGIVVDDSGQIYVADQQALAVQIFDDQGNFIRGWGRHEMGTENFSLPSGIAIDSKLRIYVTDELRHQIKVFNNDGHLVASVGEIGTGPGQLAFPTDIVVDSHDRIYVAERATARIQVFELTSRQ